MSGYTISRAGPHLEAAMVLVVAYRIHDNVVNDILAVDPFAMIFLAHFSVFVKRLETRFWLLEGLSKSLFKVVDKNLAAFPAHMTAVLWARMQVFEL
jgi:hypothetical protein